MLKEELLDYHNQIKLYKFYDYELYYKTFVKERTSDMHYLNATIIMDYFCEFENDNKYPSSTELDDIIMFVNNNPKSKLNQYLNYIPTYKENLYCQQLRETYNHHLLVSLGFGEIKHRCRKMKNYQDTFDTSCIKLIIETKSDEGDYLMISVNDKVVTVEKVYNDHNSFKINNKIFNNLALSDFINIINYNNYVTEMNLENIQAAHYFLR
jgi:hypothetical protein